MNAQTISAGARLLANDPRFNTPAARAALGVDLTTTEKALLTDCEATIQRGMNTWIDVELALRTIRDSKLYRGQFSTFNAYCHARWDFTGRRARQLLTAGKIWDSIKAEAEQKGNPGSPLPLPTSEKQIRPLVGLTPKKQLEVWETAVKSAPDGKPTSKLVSKAKAVVCPKPKGQRAEEKLVTCPDCGLEGLKASELSSHQGGTYCDRRIAEKNGRPLLPMEVDEFRIARHQNGWRIKKAPGWNVIGFTLTLREAGEWLKSLGHDPANVRVTDSGTWKSLDYWNTLGSEPGLGTQAGPAKAGTPNKPEPKEHLVLRQIAVCMDQVGVLRNEVVSSDAKSRVLIARIFDSLETLDSIWRKKTRRNPGTANGKG